jgi:intein/homing endonuclease
MLESFKNKRIHFNKKGLQRSFILKAQNSLDITQSELAQKLNISKRTLADWTKEKITMSQIKAKELSKLSGIFMSPDYSIIDWGKKLKEAGRIGGRNHFVKYGTVCVNEEYRKEKWKEWWNNIGQYKKNAPGFILIKEIKIPRKSKLLAEFIGILLGDGNISKYHIGITLSSEEKKYIKYIKKIIKKLFGVTPSIHKHKLANAVTITVNRKALVDFCQEFGFESGNKTTHQVDIPVWIKKNRAFSCECIRGLFDTDGCFFTHNYIVGGKRYSYLKIAFTNASTPLVLSVQKILINFGFNVRISKNHKDIRIEDSKYVFKYIKEIGSHNDKHLQRIKGRLR